MGKKPKSKKTAAAASTGRIKGRKVDDAPPSFPESDYWIKAKSCFLKGNAYKSNKLLLQGSKKGCTHCLNRYTTTFLYSVNDQYATNGAAALRYDLMNNHKHLHLALPFCLEATIRGNRQSIFILDRIIRATHKAQARHNNVSMVGLNTYFQKYYAKQGWTNDSAKKAVKSTRKENTTSIGSVCHFCGNEESDTVTLKKCSGCNFVFYCSAECQKKMWLFGGHAGECRQLAILKQYHRPHGIHIRDSLINGVKSKDIPELQELRRRLGLDKPTPEYEDLLEQAKSGHIEPYKLVFPNKDGTVQIGSFPHPM